MSRVQNDKRDLAAAQRYAKFPETAKPLTPGTSISQCDVLALRQKIRKSERKAIERLGALKLVLAQNRALGVAGALSAAWRARWFFSYYFLIILLLYSNRFRELK
jgi:hypothetical protein